MASNTPIGPITIKVKMITNDGQKYILNWSKKPTKPARFFGRFYCGNIHCRGNKWQSAFVWLGRGQKCRICDNLCAPREVEELHKIGTEDKNSKNKRNNSSIITSRLNHVKFKIIKKTHDYNKCEYCLERKKDCTRIPQSEWGSWKEFVIQA